MFISQTLCVLMIIKMKTIQLQSLREHQSPSGPRPLILQAWKVGSKRLSNLPRSTQEVIILSQAESADYAIISRYVEYLPFLSCKALKIYLQYVSLGENQDFPIWNLMGQYHPPCSLRSLGEHFTMALPNGLSIMILKPLRTGCTEGGQDSGISSQETAAAPSGAQQKDSMRCDLSCAACCLIPSGCDDFPWLVLQASQRFSKFPDIALRLTQLDFVSFPCNQKRRVKTEIPFLGCLQKWQHIC